MYNYIYIRRVRSKASPNVQDEYLMVATDQPVCDFVHAHTSPVADKRFTIVTIVHA